MTWQIGLDGTYRHLTVREDLLTDAQCACEDAREMMTVFVDIRSEAQEIFARSRRLVAESQRDRRLRSTTLRLVRNTE